MFNTCSTTVSTESVFEKATFDQWQSDDFYFFPTKACKEVENEIKLNKLVVVSGHSGSGKSAIIQNIALKYRNDVWNVKPLSGVKDLIDTCLQEENLKKDTLLILNDPFGKESFDEIEYNLWVKHKQVLISWLETIHLLVSCRTIVLSEYKVKRLFNDAAASIVHIDNDQYKFTEFEKRQVLNRYKSDTNLSDDDVAKIVQTETYFPLLCKIYFCKKENQQDVILFFKEPEKYVKEEIENYKNANKETYCALVLLLLFNNELRVGDLIGNKLSRKKFNCALKLCGLRDIPPYKIGQRLDTLNGFFVRKIGNTYQFYHDFLMEVTAFGFGTDFPAETIKYADISFLRRRVRLENVDEHNDRFTIYLDDKYIGMLGERLFTEIFGDNFLEVILNPCLRIEKVFEVLIRKVENNPQKMLKLLNMKKINTELQKTKSIEKESFLTNVSFVCLEENISPMFALIALDHTQLALRCLRIFQNSQLQFQNSSLLHSVCSNGSIDLYNMLSEENIKEYLEEKWGSFYPIHILSVFHNHDLLQSLLALFNIDVNVETDDKDGWTPLILASSNDINETKDVPGIHNKARQTLTLELLIKAGAKINQCSKNGFNPLYIACLNGSKITVDILLDNKADTNLCDHEGIGPLYVACQRGYDDIIKLLLNKGADTNLRTKTLSSPLYIACKEGHDSTAKLLIENGADFNIYEKEGTSPLHIACQNGHDSIVKQFIDNHANMNLCMENGESPLFVACDNGHYNIVKLLLNEELCNKPDINLCRKDGTSPLCIASLKGHRHIVQRLLINSADVNKCTIDKESPLFSASSCGHHSIVKLLLSYGADENSCKANGQSTLHVACESGNNETVRILLENKSCVNSCNNKRETPLHIACQNGSDEIVQRLLEYGADINFCDKTGKNPLYKAVSHGHCKVVKTLLDNKQNTANINEKIDGESPLYTACDYEFDDIVDLLLSRNADANICNKNNESPLYTACVKGYHSIVKLLLKHGADMNICKENGQTPLSAAVEYEHHDIVQLLRGEESENNLNKEEGKVALRH